MSRREHPGDDTWLSDQQLAKCARADEAEAFPSPIPTQIVSNGEWMPIAQTPEQKRVEARLQELADGAARKLGMSRRRFLATTGGLAAAFLAMNDVFGRFFDVSPVEMFEAKAFAESGVPGNLFVFDDQLHMVRSSILGPRFLRALAQGPTSPFPEFEANPVNPGGLLDELGSPWSPWHPSLVDKPFTDDMFQLVQFIRDVFLDSPVTVGVLSNITGFLPGVIENGIPHNVVEARDLEILTAAQTAGVRDFINQIAGSTRLLAHGLLYPGPGNLPYIEQQIAENRPDSWKGYNISLAAKVDTDPNSLMREWRLDDEAVAYPTYEVITRHQARLRRERPGFGNICVHKGFAPVSVPEDDRPERGNPDDIPKVARDWRNLNFIIYHACIEPGLFYSPQPLTQLLSPSGAPLRAGVPDIRWTTRFALMAREHANVYAEIGSTFASTITTFPTVWAHLIGQLLTFMGPQHIVFGSDSVWYGAPWWQIEAFWRFQIPEPIRERWGYRAISETDKRHILGLNSARLYRLPATREPASRSRYRPVPENYADQIPDELKTLLEFPGSASDNLLRVRNRYLATGSLPSHTRHGWIRMGV
jgi:hypothetical protein